MLRACVETIPDSLVRESLIYQTAEMFTFTFLCDMLKGQNNNVSSALVILQFFSQALNKKFISIAPPAWKFLLLLLSHWGLNQGWFCVWKGCLDQGQTRVYFSVNDAWPGSLTTGTGQIMSLNANGNRSPQPSNKQWDNSSCQQVNSVFKVKWKLEISSFCVWNRISRG